MAETDGLVQQVASAPVALGNLQHVRNLRPCDGYHHPNWMQAVLLHFDTQTTARQREIRGMVGQHGASTSSLIPTLGVTSDQLAAALTLGDRLPAAVAKQWAVAPPPLATRSSTSVATQLCF